MFNIIPTQSTHTGRWRHISQSLSNFIATTNRNGNHSSWTVVKETRRSNI